MSYQLPPYTVSHPLSAASVKEVDWGVGAYGIPELWKECQGEGVRIAVIDSGVANHYALQSVVERRNFSTDDVAEDLIGHGTHVAGIICGSQAPCMGIAKKAIVHSLKVLGENGQCSSQSVCEALEYATEIGCDIACLSLGSTKESPLLHAAVQGASKSGMIIVAAAGNSGGRVNYPAAFEETVAVGAVDRNGEICPFSCKGEEVICAAPGQDIQSTWLANGYAVVSGTSMAAPFVVGVVALYIGTLGRKLTPQELLDALQATSSDAGVPGRDDEYGWGLVNPHKLVKYRTTQVDGVAVYRPEE